jgi:hypothetical protein
MVRCRALPLSAIICGYADASLDASDNGKGDSEGSAIIFDWEGDEDFYLEPSTLLSVDVINLGICAQCAGE